MSLRAFVLLSAVLALGPPPRLARGDDGPGPPLTWQEPGPTARLFLQLPLDRPEPVAEGEVSGVVRLIYSNALVVGESARAAADLDLETATLTTAMRIGVRDDLEVFVGVPVVADSGGVFDAAIDGVESAFDSRNFQRRGRPNGLARYQLTGPAGTLERTGSAARLGDALAGAKWLLALADGPWPTTSVRGAVKAPTGGATAGSGHWDAAAGVLMAWPLGRAAVRLALDLTVPGGGPAGTGLSTRPVPAAQLGVAIRLAGALTGHLQVSAHPSALERTGIPQLDRSIYDAVFGFGFPVAPGVDLQIAGAENFASPRRGADASVLLALVGR